MHILMVMDIPFDTGSWVGRYMPLASYLGRKGYKITILMPNHDPKKEGYYLEGAENVFIYETGIPFFRKLGETRQNYSTLVLCKIGLQNIIKAIWLSSRFNPDLVVVCKPLPIAATVGLFFKIVKRKKVILDCDDAEVAINSVRSELQRNIIHIFENTLPKLCDMILVNSEYTFNRIKKIGVAENKIAYIPNGVDVLRFSKDNYNVELEKDFAANKIILYFGDLNFNSGHNIDILLHAFKILLHMCPSAKLLIIGDGADEGNLKRIALQLRIDANILWKGRIRPEDVPGYISISDVVVDPVRDVLSNWARCPVKIIEAMYLGCPVVTSDIGDSKWLLGDFGFFAKQGDPHSMAEKIKEAIENESFKKNRQLVIERALEYSWDNLTDKIELLSKNLMIK